MKERTVVPPEIRSQVLFDSDRTCCVCQQPGLEVQIHHIDDDTSNHDPENLAVLCFEDHNRTQIRGGFGRKLTALDVRKHRGDWVERVRQRRARADELAAQAMARAVAEPPKRSHGRFIVPPAALISTLPAIRKEALAMAHQHWPGFATADVMDKLADYIESLKGILTTLAAFYPINHFGDKPARLYFDEQILDRGRWHRAHMEPGDPGSGGTIIGPMVAARVAGDVEQMIVDIVAYLNLDPDREPKFEDWKAAWDAAGQS